MPGEALHHKPLRSSLLLPRARDARTLVLPLFTLVLAFLICEFACAQTLAGQAPAMSPSPVLPSAPQQQNPNQPSAISDTQATNPSLVNPPSQKPAKSPRPLDPCAVKNAGASMAATGGLRAVSVLGVGETTRDASAAPVESTVCLAHAPLFNWYVRFVTGPEWSALLARAKTSPRRENSARPFQPRHRLWRGWHWGRRQLPHALRPGLSPDGASCPVSTSPRT